MRIGGTKIVVVAAMPGMIMGVVMGVIVVVPMPAPLIVAVIAAQQERTGHVDRQAQRSDPCRFREGHVDGLEKAHDGFTRNAQRHDAQHHRRGESRQIADLARAETVTTVEGVTPGVGIGERRRGERAGVRGHVEAIGQQRHRAGQPAREDLAHHHRAGQGHHPSRAARVLVVGRAQEDVVVRQRIGIGRGYGHGAVFHLA